MGQARWDNHDLSCPPLKRRRANRKGDGAFLDDKDLLIGMLMQPHAIPWWHVHPNKRKFGISMPVSLELIGVPVTLKFVPVHNGVVHVGLLCLPVITCAHP